MIAAYVLALLLSLAVLAAAWGMQDADPETLLPDDEYTGRHRIDPIGATA